MNMGILKSFDDTHYDVVRTGHQYLDEVPEKKTGIEGIKSIFSVNQDGVVDPRCRLLQEAGSISVLVGTLYGGMSKARKSWLQFIEKNKYAKYDSVHHARREMNARIYKGFASGAWYYTWRFALFSNSCLFMAMAIPAYRGKYSPFDLSLSCAVVGAAYRFRVGPKPAVAGAALGTVAGTAAWALLSATGQTVDDFLDTKRMMLVRASRERERLLQEERAASGLSWDQEE